MSEGKRYKIRNFIDVPTAKADSSINPVDLNSAMMDQASMALHYGILAAQASRQVDDVKLKLDNVEAKIDRLLRDDAASAGTKITEPQIEKLIARNAEVIAVRRALNEAKQIEAVAKAACLAFRDRKDMLVQMGANERKEMEGELVVRARETQEQRARNDQAAILRRQKEKLAGQQQPA